MSSNPETTTDPHNIEPGLIAFAGDWHGNPFWSKYAIDAAARSGVDVIIQVGDFDLSLGKNFLRGIRRKLAEYDQHLYFIDGNHDNHPKLRKWKRDEWGFGVFPFESTGSDRIHYVPRGHRWSWWGKDFMGFGGAHSVDRQARTWGHDWFPEEIISPSDLDYACRPGNVDIMITHDNPQCSKPPTDRKYSGWPEAELNASNQNRQVIQTVVDEKHPELLVHGHHHVRYDQQIGQLHVVGLDKDMSSVDDNLYIVDSSLNELPVIKYLPNESE